MILSLFHPSTNHRSIHDQQARADIDPVYLNPDRVALGPNVTPNEHALIMRTYNDLKSMGKVAAKLQRSKDTIQRAVKRHNETIEECTYCLECRNCKEPLEKTVLKGKLEHGVMINL